MTQTTPKQALIKAIHEHDRALVRTLLAKHPGLAKTPQSEKGPGMIHLASQYNAPEIVQDLIDHGASANDLSCIDSTPIHYAILNGAEASLEVLLENGADTSLKDSFKIPALSNSIGMRGKTMFYRLLDLVEDIEQADSFDRTPLMRAATTPGWLDEVKLLHARGASLTHRDNQGNNILHLAAEKGDLASVQYIVAQVPELISQTNDEGELPVMKAVQHGKSTARLEYLLSQTPPELADKALKEKIFLHAAKHLMPEVMEVMLRKGVRHDVRNEDGLTPIQQACKSGMDLIVPPLLRHGASLFKPVDGQRPFDLIFTVQDKQKFMQMHAAHVTERTKRLRRRTAPRP